MELALEHFNAVMFKCAVCMGFPNEPKMLSCNHTFCKQCLITQMDKEGSTEYCECPTCQFQTKISGIKAVESLKDNIFVKKAKQMCLESKSKFYCNLCDADATKEAIYICTECKPNCNLCSEHLKFHSRLCKCNIANLLTIQEYLDNAAHNQEDHIPPDMCPQHKKEQMKLILACTNCKHPMCLLCQAVKKCPACGPMSDRDNVEELGESTEKLNHELDRLVNGNGNNTQEAKELLQEFERIQKQLNVSFTETQKLIEDHYSKLLENAAQSIKLLREHNKQETAIELTKVQETIDTVKEYLRDCEVACSKAALAKMMPPIEMARILSALKTQLESSCPKLKVEEPRYIPYITPSDEELESDLRRLTGFFQQLQHKVINQPKEAEYAVCDAVYSEYRGSFFVSCQSSGLYEAGAGGERKVDRRESNCLCLSVCGKKLYSGSTKGAVHVFELTGKSGRLRHIRTITIPDATRIFSVSASATGEKVAVADGESVSVLTQCDGKVTRLKGDDAVFGGSGPCSVQWVGKQSLCLVLCDDRVVLITLDPVHTVWTTKLTKPGKVSSAGGRLFVSHEGDDHNKLTVLDEQSGAAVGVITCPGRKALGVCTLQNGTVAALSDNNNKNDCCIQ